MGSIGHRLRKLEQALGPTSSEEDTVRSDILDAALKRLGNRRVDLIYDVLERKVFSGPTIPLVDLPYDLLSAEEVEALESLSVAIQEVMDEEY
jgi:hypothetical protein